MSDLNKKVAVVTGSTSGIGEGIARMLSQAGTYVVINSVSSIEKGRTLAQELGNAMYVQGNIGVEADCQRIIAETTKRYGRLDVLVNNAGQSARISGDVLDMSNEYFSTVLNTNVVGTWCLIRESLPYLQQSGDGHIVNITSCAGIDPASASSAIAYSVAKAAINHLTKFIAKHAGPRVRANAIAPGLIMTPRTENFDEAVNKFKQRTPLQRTGVPEDIAELVLAVIKSNYINGEVILADGGFSTS
jgi:ketoreductase RED2